MFFGGEGGLKGGDCCSGGGRFEEQEGVVGVGMKCLRMLFDLTNKLVAASVSVERT
jgi:hypothetical protein